MIDKEMIKTANQNYFKTIMVILIIKIGILGKVLYFLITKKDFRIKKRKVKICNTSF